MAKKKRRRARVSVLRRRYAGMAVCRDGLRLAQRDPRAQRIGVRACENGVDALHAEVGAPDAAEDHRGAHDADEGDGLAEDDEARDHGDDGNEKEEVADLSGTRFLGGALPEERAERGRAHGEEDEKRRDRGIHEGGDRRAVFRKVERHDGDEAPAEGLAGHEEGVVLVHALEKRRVAGPGEGGAERKIKARCGELLHDVVVKPDEAHAGCDRHDAELRHPVKAELVVKRNDDEPGEERRRGHDGRDGARVGLLERQVFEPVVKRDAGDAEERELRFVKKPFGEQLLVGEKEKDRVGEEGADRQNRKGTEALRVEPLGGDVGKPLGGDRCDREKIARKRRMNLRHRTIRGVSVPPLYCGAKAKRRWGPAFLRARRGRPRFPRTAPAEASGLRSR